MLGITSLTLPQGLRWIGECALKGCRPAELIVPDSVTRIGFNAFLDIPHITYHGSAPTRVMGDVYDPCEDDQNPVFDWVWGFTWTRGSVENKRWGAKSMN